MWPETDLVASDRLPHVRSRQIVSLLTSALLLTGCSTLEPGPIERPSDHGYGGMVVDVGDTFTDGFEGIFVTGDKPVTITKIELVGTPSALQLGEVMLAGDERDGNFQFDATYPPSKHQTGPLVAAVGATLLPQSQQNQSMFGYELIMPITVTEAGRWVRGGYRLEYEIDGVKYGWDSVAEITICTPDFVDDDGSCPMAED